MNASLILVFAALTVCAAPAVAQDAVAPADAERRMTELAQRFAGDEPDGASVAPGASSSAPASIEDTPLGLGAGADGASLLGESGGPASGGLASGGGGGWALSTLAALGVVIGLIFAARWAYAKMGGTVIARPSPVVEVLSRTAVAPKNHVLLLRVGQRVLVVGDSSSGLNTLADVTDPEEVAGILQSVSAHGERSVTKSFNSLVSRFNGEYEGKTVADLEGGDHGEVHLDRTRDSLSGLASKLRGLGGRGGAA